MSKQDQNIALILSSARKLFNKFGFRKTTMDEIAFEAGKGKSSLYYYFKSKEEVFAAVVEQEAAWLEQRVEKAISQHEKAAGKLRAYVKVRLESVQEMANLYEAIKDEFLSHYTQIQNIRKKYYDQEIENVRRILQMGVENQRFDLKNATFTARAIVTVIKALEIPLTFEMPDRNLDKEINDVMDIILYGIIKR
ncbi:MAG: TetR/AcrR family transcriptional regulator; helix-turn-helix transcriptional regulator [Bacteroidales bacterium]|nr:TetR/AcrR family transcriptional regulator; helix-turn-helix transcriptional regulator [Bacteroidales bacterium]MCF8333169.1 TetR/AcrR family transcriptional regulator; helix-turn-helix transcriptional regulator [Bacteroidales bacterium]